MTKNASSHPNRAKSGKMVQCYTRSWSQKDLTTKHTYYEKETHIAAMTFASKLKLS